MDTISIYHTLKNECQSQITTDTRTLLPDSLFVALRGEHWDGNQFALSALSGGCAYALVDDPTLADVPGCLYVPNVETTLHAIARYHRRNFNIPVIAITGSNGKTTTKELIASCLQTQRSVVATKGNYNNHIGVPLTLLEIDNDTDIAVIEMGANHVGEIAMLTKLAEPTHGVITNIGRAHLGNFGSFEKVISAKSELYEYLRATDGEVLVNADDELLMELSAGMKRTLYGSTIEGPYHVVGTHTVPFVTAQWNHFGTIKTNLVGEYNIMNIACAITVATRFDILPLNIVTALQSYQPSNLRSELLITDRNNLVIKDYYNANPSSMSVAIQNARNMRGSRDLILILGDMFELGEYAIEEHQKVIDEALSIRPSKLIVVGATFYSLAKNEVAGYPSTAELIASIHNVTFENSVILLKGSRGMHLEEIFEAVSW